MTSYYFTLNNFYPTNLFLDVLASLDFKLSLAQGVWGLGKFPKQRFFGRFPKNQVMQVSLAHLWVDFRVIIEVLKSICTKKGPYIMKWFGGAKGPPQIMVHGNYLLDHSNQILQTFGQTPPLPGGEEQLKTIRYTVSGPVSIHQDSSICIHVFPPVTITLRFNQPSRPYIWLLEYMEEIAICRDRIFTFTSKAWYFPWSKS